MAFTSASREISIDRLSHCAQDVASRWLFPVAYAIAVATQYQAVNQSEHA